MTTTIFTNALGTNRVDSSLVSLRNVLPITGGAQSQVRITFTSAAGNGFICDHASIGISSGTTMITTATPVELLFGGVSGCSIAAGASITSDFVNFAGFTSSDKLVVIIDEPATTVGVSTDQSGPAGVTTYYLFGDASYNKTDPTADGAWGTIGWVWGVTLIETQATGAVVIPNKVYQSRQAVKRAAYY